MDETRSTRTEPKFPRKPSLFHSSLRQEPEVFDFGTLLEGDPALEKPGMAPLDQAVVQPVRSLLRENGGLTRLRGAVGGSRSPILRTAIAVGGLAGVPLIFVLYLALRNSAPPAGAQPPSTPTVRLTHPRPTIQRYEPNPSLDAMGASERPGMQAGTMRLIKAAALSGRFSYWFVSANARASKQQPLPSPDGNGVISLLVPAQYNRPGTQLRVLDAGQGKIARLPLIDFSHQASVVRRALSPNLLQNAGFMGKMEHWTLEQTVGTADSATELLDGLSAPPGVSGRVARFTIQSLGSQNWSIQCYQQGIDLVEGQPYQISFWARADRSRPFTVDTILDQPNWRVVGVQTEVSLSPHWQKYELTFKAVDTTPGHARLSFVLGDAVGVVEIAGVSLRHVDGPDVQKAASPYSALSLTPADFN